MLGTMYTILGTNFTMLGIAPTMLHTTAYKNVGLDVRIRVDVNERDLDAVSVRTDPWIQLCVEVRVAVYVCSSTVQGPSSTKATLSLWLCTCLLVVL